MVLLKCTGVPHYWGELGTPILALFNQHPPLCHNCLSLKQGLVLEYCTTSTAVLQYWLVVVQCHYVISLTKSQTTIPTITIYHNCQRNHLIWFIFKESASADQSGSLEFDINWKNNISERGKFSAF